MKIILSAIIVLLNCWFASAQHYRKSILEQPYKFGIGYVGGPWAIRVEAGYMLFHENLLNPHQHQPYSEITNHNISIGVDANFNSDICLGPKLEYEVNFIFLQGKLNFLNLTNFNHENNVIFRPEIGLTLFGTCSVSYGRNIVIHKNEFNLIGKNQISFTANLNFL